MKQAIRDLVEISHYAAQHPRFVQGGGGNCSVKPDQNTMLIKASGIFLEDVTESGGFVTLNRETGRKTGHGPALPSLEAPLHGLLGAFIIHTHPIPAGVLLCTEEGKKAFPALFPEPLCLWVDYANPGVELHEKISGILQSKSADPAGDLVLFLENHGIFVSSPLKERCMELHEWVIRKLENLFTLEEPPPSKGAPSEIKGYLTPDHAVYGHMDRRRLSGRQRTAVIELDEMSFQIKRIADAKRWRLRFLPDHHVTRILGMTQEKYRQNILKNSP